MAISNEYVNSLIAPLKSPFLKFEYAIFSLFLIQEGESPSLTLYTLPSPKLSELVLENEKSEQPSIAYCLVVVVMFVKHWIFVPKILDYRMVPIL